MGSHTRTGTLPAETARLIPAGRRIGTVELAAAAVVLALAWVLGATALRTPLLVTWQGAPAEAPLYAFFEPVLSPRALVFFVTAALASLCVPRLADPRRTQASAFAAILAALALALPFALFLVRAAPGGLGSQFLTYRDEEFFHDAQRVASAASFLDTYVERMPSLSLHGRHFPPGNALLLHFVRELLGPSPLAAGVLVLACFPAALLLLLRAAAARLGEAAGRQAALLCLAAPAALDFACTSMDAVFLLLGALVLVIGSRAHRADAGRRTAIALGLALLSATCFSFSALPLGLWVLVETCCALRSSPRALATRLALIAGAYAGGALLLDLVTGFPIWECLRVALASSVELMSRASGGDPGRHAFGTAYGNAVAYALGAGLPLCAAAAASLRAGAWRAPHVAATVATLAVMTAGGIYFLETERIWLFTLPWLGAAALAAGPFEPRSLRTLFALGCLQALAFEVVLFTLW